MTFLKGKFCFSTVRNESNIASQWNLIRQQARKILKIQAKLEFFVKTKEIFKNYVKNEILADNFTGSWLQFRKVRQLSTNVKHFVKLNSFIFTSLVTLKMKFGENCPKISWNCNTYLVMKNMKIGVVSVNIPIKIHNFESKGSM